MVVWANHRVWEEPAGLSAAGHGCMGATSRVRREAYARFCERQGVRLPLPTRRLETGHGLGTAAPAAECVDSAGSIGYRASPRLCHDDFRR